LIVEWKIYSDYERRPQGDNRGIISKRYIRIYFCLEGRDMWAGFIRMLDDASAATGTNAFSSASSSSSADICVLGWRN
jgi:hypothetical protein